MRLFFYSAILLIFAGCSVSEPKDYTEVQNLPRLFPDYTEVTVPANIAPLNFMVDDSHVDACIARIDYPGGSLLSGKGDKVVWDASEWNRAVSAARGGSMQISLYTRSEGKWLRHPSFSVQVAEEEIDPWLSYRLIEPSYVAYEDIDLMQRNLTSFEESIIASNHIGGHKEQCLNCHSYQNYKTENMLFHIRGAGGGTMLVYKDQARLMTALRRKGMISNPVYPSWHPTKPLIAFSTNHTGQFFHTQHTDKVEVMDSESELVIYDVECDSMILLPSDSSKFDNFPTWSPDGRQLYYTSAQYIRMDSTMTMDREMANNYQMVQYNLFVRDFDPDSKVIGEERLLYDVVSAGQSATLPRVSPDGRSLLYASGLYGCFHIWHTDADIRLLNLETLEVDSLQALNSPRAESYPTWSSNGRWIICASRRDDGNYSRVYISYYDREGKAHKAFAVPQEDPEHDKLLLRSYNRPETMIEPVKHRMY